MLLQLLTWLMGDIHTKSILNIESWRTQDEDSQKTTINFNRLHLRTRPYIPLDIYSQSNNLYKCVLVDWLTELSKKTRIRDRFDDVVYKSTLYLLTLFSLHKNDVQSVRL